MSHPFYYTRAILPQEAVQEFYHRDIDALQVRMLAAVQEVAGGPENLELALAKLHVISGLYDSAQNGGRACSLVSDIINF